MVAPVRHVGSVEDLDAGELLELMTTAQRGAARRVPARRLQPRRQRGRDQDAGFAGHVNLHVVPRGAADNNVVAVTAETRVLPQSLQDTYAALRGRFATATGGAP
jgi:ATP adenylyltransferase